MRLMGPGHSARIARFQGTRFSSRRIRSSRLGLWSPRNLLLVRNALFLLVAAIPFPTHAHAQSVFHFSKEVHWGETILPPGDYVITSLDVKNTGAVVTFATPNGKAQSSSSGTQDAGRQEIVSGDSPSVDGGLFTIRNLRNQTVPDSEAQTIYLSACRVVEQEFGRTTPLRPRLALLLGADSDRVYYPKREIQLTKWDKYKFAEGVVILAVDALLPEGEKLSLSKLAVVEAESTVDVHELKINRTALRPSPRN